MLVQIEEVCVFKEYPQKEMNTKHSSQNQYSRNIFCIVHLLLFTFLFYGSIAKSQDKPTFNLQGVVASGEYKLEGASIQLLALEKKVPARHTMSGVDGKFIFSGLSSGSYLLSIGYMGYKSYTSDTLKVSADLVLPIIKLETISSNLKEVQVVAELPAVVQQLDKLVIDVSRNVAANGSSALEVLEKSPGISLDQNGNLMMKGKADPVVMINGRPVQLSGTDLTEMLRGIAANNINKVELISNPSARYEAAGNAGIIDIKLNKAIKKGMNGNISLNGGSGKFFKSNNGGNFNYRQGDFSATANYNYAYRGDFVDMEATHRFGERSDGVASSFQDFYQDITFGSHTSRLGMEYLLGKNTTLGTELFSTFTKINRDIDNVTSLYGADKNLNGFRNMLTNTINDRKNYGVNFNVRHLFDTLGTAIGMDIDLAKFNLDDRQSYDFGYLNANHQPTKDPISLFNNSDGILDIRSGAVNFEKPFLKGKLELGGKFSHISSVTDVDFYDRIGQELLPNAELSSTFNYNEQIQAGFANYGKKLDKINLQLGLRAERTVGQGRGMTTFGRKYVQLFPSGAISYQLNQKHGLGFNFSRRIGRPSYSQLNPYFYFIEPTIRVAGNPELLPALNYTMDINYTLNSKYIIGLNYFRSTNPITETQILDNANNILVGFTNLESYESYSLVLTLPFKLTKWFSSSTNLSGFYGSYYGEIDGQTVSNARPHLTINSSNSFTFGKWSAQLIGNYNGRQYYGNIELKANMSITAAVQRSFMNKKATLGINLSDVFFTNNIRWANAMQRFTVDGTRLRDSRTALLNFTYKFGGNESSLRRKSGSAEEEKSRAN